MAVLRSVIQKIAAVVRVFAVGYMVVQVAVWHAFFAAHPWLLAGHWPRWPGGSRPRPICAAAARGRR